MSEVTIWSCGDIRTALDLNNTLRRIGFKCRVHDTDNRSAKTPWRYGQHIIVGSGECYPDVARESKVLFWGLAALEYSTKQGGSLMRNPPGLQHAAETLLCTTTCAFGNKRTSVVIESEAETYYFSAVPRGWKCAAMNERDKPVIAQLNNNFLIPYTLTQKSSQYVLERILTGWESKRVDPCEYAIKKALTSARQQCTNASQDVVVGYSGGLFSFVTHRILVEALGSKRVIACYIDTGLYDNLTLETKAQFQKNNVRVLNVRQEAIGALSGESSIHKRRKILNGIFTTYCKSVSRDPYLAQGASYESIVRGIGETAINCRGIIQPLENLSVSEVELIGKRMGFQKCQNQMSAAGYSDLIRGPFSSEALALSKRVNSVCERFTRQFNANHCHADSLLIKVQWELDVFSAVPRVLLWLFTSKDGKAYQPEIRQPQMISKLGDLLYKETRDVANDIAIFTNI